MVSGFLLKSISTATVSAALVALDVQIARADRRDFYVYNGNRQTIVQFYVSPPNSDYWGKNVLSDVLYSGNRTLIYFTNNSNRCVYDLKAVYSDGSYDQGRFNLCKTSRIDYTGNGGDFAPR
jgi:hypothetical protein